MLEWMVLLSSFEMLLSVVLSVVKRRCFLWWRFVVLTFNRGEEFATFGREIASKRVNIRAVWC